MSIYIYVLVMAVTTYLIRALPLTVFRKPIRSRFLRSFLHYVPTACLTAMTFPAIFKSTGSTLSSAAGCIVAILLAYFGRGLLTVAVGAAAVAFIVQIAGF